MRESVQRSVENIFPSFRLFLSSASLLRPPIPQWKPLELRKIDKSPTAEQFVYSAARLRANELERITYSYGLALSSFLLKSRSSMILLPTLCTHLPSPPSRGRGRCSFRYPPRVRTCLLYPFNARRPILSRELATFNRFLCRQTIICLAIAQCPATPGKNHSLLDVNANKISQIYFYDPVRIF